MYQTSMSGRSEGIGRLVDALIGKMHNVRVPFGGRYMIQFRDREHEAGLFLREVLRYSGLGFIYGPYGAGKTTFLSTMAQVINSINQPTGILIAYMNFTRDAIQAELPRGLISRRDEIVSKLEGMVRVNVPIGPSPGSISIDLGQVLDAARYIIKAILDKYRNSTSDIENLVIIYDGLDDFLKERVGVNSYIILSTKASFFANSLENLSKDLWGELTGKAKKILFAVSDQAAMKVAETLISKAKALTTPYLFWSLPKAAFECVVKDVADLTGASSDIDAKLLWNLMGGNVRELEYLALRYGWVVDKWLRARVVDFLTGFMSNEELNWLIESGQRVMRTELRRDEQFVGQPDAVALNDLYVEQNPLLRRLFELNILLRVNIPMTEPLSELPSEPWIGEHYAYQLPAYYWALRAMIEGRKVNVEAGSILKAIEENVK